jgi:hypothetical protein
MNIFYFLHVLILDAQAKACGYIFLLKAGKARTTIDTKCRPRESGDLGSHLMRAFMALILRAFAS